MHRGVPGSLASAQAWVAVTWFEGSHGSGDPILLIGPLGCEWERSQRSLSLLAARLAGKGSSVLQLDVSGSGDSAGELGDYGPSDWEADAALGLEEVLRRTGAQRAAVCGFRLGCRIALALGHHPAVSSLILREPVLSGAHQLSEWMNAERRLMSHLGEVPQLSAGGFPTACLGQAIPPALQVALNAWTEPSPAPHGPVWWLSAAPMAPRWAVPIPCPGPPFWEVDPSPRTLPLAMIGVVAHAIRGIASRR